MATLRQLTLLLLLILLGLCPSAVHAQQLKAIYSTEAQSLSLDDAVRLAINNNFTLKNDAIDISIARDKKDVMRANYFPQVHVQTLGLQLLTPLNFNFNKGVFGTYPATGPIPGENLNVTTDQRPILFVNTVVAQPILQLPRVALAVRANALAVEIARSKLRMRQLDIVNQVKRLYYQALELNDAVKVTQASEALLREADRTTSDYLAKEMVLPSDALEIKQQLANVELEALKAHDGFLSAQEQLNLLMGRDVRTQFSLVALREALPAEMTVATAQTRALAMRQELRQAAKQEEQVNLEKRIKQLEYLPDLSLVFDYLSMFGTQVIPKNVAVVGLFLNWQPVDFGKRNHELMIERKTLRQLQNGRAQLESSILVEVSSALRNMREAKQQVEVAKLSRDVALEKVRVANNRYKSESALLQEVLRAQKDLSEATYKYNQALSNIWRARADLEKAMGEG